MGKRNKKKLRKIMRARLEQKNQAIQSETTADNPPSDIESSVESKPQITDRPIEIEDERTVKAEIRKILLTILVLVLLVVAVYFINAKSDIILKIGQFIASKMNLSI